MESTKTIMYKSMKVGDVSVYFTDQGEFFVSTNSSIVTVGAIGMLHCGTFEGNYALRLGTCVTYMDEIYLFLDPCANAFIPGRCRKNDVRIGGKTAVRLADIINDPLVAGVRS